MCACVHVCVCLCVRKGGCPVCVCVCVFVLDVWVVVCVCVFVCMCTGVSVLGCVDLRQPLDQGAISFQLGIGRWRMTLTVPSAVLLVAIRKALGQTTLLCRSL